jgi:cell division protein FtsB
MFRRTAPPPLEDASDETGDDASLDPSTGFQPFGPGGPDLAGLPIAGITQRRLAILLGALVAAWIVLLFARQVSEASAASSRAEAMIAENAVRHAQIAALERELDRIQQPRFILQQARAHGLGGHNEIAFTLDPDAPPLPANAPGSAALRVGAPTAVSPLESWLSILFGSTE